MNTAYLILGCNKGNTLQNLQQAINLLNERAGSIQQQSDIYKTAAWGNTNQPDFLNQAVCIKTTLTASSLLDTILAIEKQLGRVRDDQKWMERTMDIDILFFNDECILTESLTVPHPFIQDRKFVLVPMAQLAASLVHPVLQKSIAELLVACTDNLKITPLHPINAD